MEDHASSTSPTSAAMALRESFGDRKIPDITRKITACVTCRKRKIKCHMIDAEPPCARCKSRGLSCVVNKSIQMLLENDLTWKEKMEKRISELERKLASSEERTMPSNSTTYLEQQPISLQAKIVNSTKSQQAITRIQDPLKKDQDANVTLNLFCSLGAFPASSMEGTTMTNANQPSSLNPDFISKGILELSNAQAHFDFFHKHLNFVIFKILDSEIDLVHTRSKSSFLLLAVCVVAAYCSGSSDYQILLDAFKNEVSSKLFSCEYTFDDVRALCIGAFWLSEISAALNSLAVRISTELNLHRCITKMPFVKKECYERTRLYFVVYVCDHHCSLSHGRPPMTREFISMMDVRTFLKSQFSSPTDLQLISQVELWSMNTRVFDIYGADIENASIRNDAAEIENISMQYDKWHQEWGPVLSLRLESELYCQALMELYFHSAKLYLFSHVFRGSAQRDQQPPVNAHGLNIFAQNAVQSASSIIQSITGNAKARTWLTQLPYYLTTTVAFASVFVLRTSTQSQYNPDKEHSLGILRQLSDLLQSLIDVIEHSNPLLRVANSLFIATGGHSEPVEVQADQAAESLAMMPEFDLNTGIFDFDFLGNDEHWLLSHSGLETSAIHL